jgi:hypothetical protein
MTPHSHLSPMMGRMQQPLRRQASGNFRKTLTGCAQLSQARAQIPIWISTYCLRLKSKMNKRQKEALKHPNVLGAGAKKRRRLHKNERAAVIVEEFKRGTLHSGSGAIVTKPSQMRAIINSETKRSTKGSQPFSGKELMQGYRRM